MLKFPELRYDFVLTCRVKMCWHATRSTHIRQSTLSVVCVESRASILLDPNLMARESPSIVLILALLAMSLSPLLMARTMRSLWNNFLPSGRGQRSTHNFPFAWNNHTIILWCCFELTICVNLHCMPWLRQHLIVFNIFYLWLEKV